MEFLKNDLLDFPPHAFVRVTIASNLKLRKFIRESQNLIVSLFTFTRFWLATFGDSLKTDLIQIRHPLPIKF